MHQQDRGFGIGGEGGDGGDNCREPKAGGAAQIRVEGNQAHGQRADAGGDDQPRPPHQSHTSVLRRTEGAVEILIRRCRKVRRRRGGSPLFEIGLRLGRLAAPAPFAPSKAILAVHPFGGGDDGHVAGDDQLPENWGAALYVFELWEASAQSGDDGESLLRLAA